MNGKYTVQDLAVTSPWLAAKGCSYNTGKRNTLSHVVIVVREGYKATNKQTAFISACLSNWREIVDLKTVICIQASLIHPRDVVRRVIRRQESYGGTWKLQVLDAMLFDAINSSHNGLMGRIKVSSQPHGFITFAICIKQTNMELAKVVIQRGWNIFLYYLT